MPSLQKAIDAMAWAADSNKVGYSQSDRTSVWGNFFKNGKYNADCSSLVVGALKYAGFNVGNASYTGNFLEELVPRGWKKIKPDGNPKPGDILLNVKNHTAMYIGNGMVAEASRDEHGRYTGGKRGDQDGNEVRRREYYTFQPGGWNWYLRWSGASAAAPSSTAPATTATAKPKQKPREPEYRVFRDGSWRYWQHGGASAGVSGSAIYDFEAKNLGKKGWYQLTLEDGTVLPKNKGNAKHAKRVIGITVYYSTDNPAKTGYWEAMYRVQTVDGRWLKWEHDDDCGGAGDDANPIARIQLKLAACG